MPLKNIIKILWISNLIFLLIVMGFGALILMRPVTLPQIDISDPPGMSPQQPRTMYYYQDIWMADVLKKKPKIEIKTPEPRGDIYRQLIERNVKIDKILSPRFAMLTINNKESQLYRVKPTDLQNSGIQPRKNPNDLDPWQLKIEIHTISIIEINPDKGIRFRFDSMGIEIFLEHKEAIRSGPPSTNFKTNNPTSGISKIEENHWAVSSQEGTRLLQNYDQQIEQLGPKIEYDEISGQPIGVKLQGVPSDSDAYKFGLRQNDIVQNINGSAINATNPEFIKQLINTHKHSNQITVEVLRNGRVERILFDVTRGQ